MRETAVERRDEDVDIRVNYEEWRKEKLERGKKGGVGKS